MNVTLVDNTTLVQATTLKESPLKVRPIGGARQFIARATTSPWRWVTVTCMILVISGGIRYWRESHFQTLAQMNEVSPFPLAQLPKVLGNWRMVEGADSKLDPEIARVAGAKDSLDRAYQDDRTGEVVSVLVVYGLATELGHVPEVCYPAAGYQLAGESADRELVVAGSTAARYRTVHFSRGSGAIANNVEVSYTFLNNKQWLPDVESRWKTFRVHPAMFKVQLQREAGSSSFETSPSESLLAELIEEINRRLENPKS